jgi:hypothetical protein
MFSLFLFAGFANPDRVLRCSAPASCRTGKKRDTKLISLLHTSYVNYISLNACEQGVLLIQIRRQKPARTRYGLRGAGIRGKTQKKPIQNLNQDCFYIATRNTQHATIHTTSFKIRWWILVKLNIAFYVLIIYNKVKRTAVAKKGKKVCVLHG